MRVRVATAASSESWMLFAHEQSSSHCPAYHSALSGRANGDRGWRLRSGSKLRVRVNPMQRIKIRLSPLDVSLRLSFPFLSLSLFSSPSNWVVRCLIFGRNYPWKGTKWWGSLCVRKDGIIVIMCSVSGFYFARCCALASPSRQARWDEIDPSISLLTWQRAPDFLFRACVRGQGRIRRSSYDSGERFVCLILLKKKKRGIFWGDFRLIFRGVECDASFISCLDFVLRDFGSRIKSRLLKYACNMNIARIE